MCKVGGTHSDWGSVPGGFEVKAQGERSSRLGEDVRPELQGHHRKDAGANGSHDALPQTVVGLQLPEHPSVRCNIGDGELPCQI